MKEQTITTTTENKPYVPPLSDYGAHAFYSALLEKIKEINDAEKSKAA